MICQRCGIWEENCPREEIERLAREKPISR